MEILKTITANGKTYRNTALCQTGTGAPTTVTVGQPGQLYMDTDTGNLYKCTAAADGVYTWESMSNGGYVVMVSCDSEAQDERRMFTAVNLDFDKLLAAAMNGQCVVARVFNRPEFEDNDLWLSGDFICVNCSQEERYATFAYTDSVGDQIQLEIWDGQEEIYWTKKKIGSNIPLTITITIDQADNVSCDTRYDEIYNAVGANRAVLAVVNADTGHDLIKYVLSMGICHYGTSSFIKFGTQLVLYDDNTWEYQP